MEEEWFRQPPDMVSFIEPDEAVQIDPSFIGEDDLMGQRQPPLVERDDLPPLRCSSAAIGTVSSLPT